MFAALFWANVLQFCAAASIDSIHKREELALPVVAYMTSPEVLRQIQHTDDIDASFNPLMRAGLADLLPPIPPPPPVPAIPAPPPPPPSGPPPPGLTAVMGVPGMLGLPPIPPPPGSTPTPTPTPTALGPPGELPAGPCKTYAIVSARGTGETQVNPTGSRSLINTVLTNVPGGESYEVVYPASSNFMTDPENGAADMVKHIDAILTKCPKQRIVCFGYSQGAMVIINAMNNPTIRARASNVRASVFYGNPYYRSGLPQDRGTATSGSGIGLLKNLMENANEVPPEFAATTRDFCNDGDPVCQGILHLKLSDVGNTLVGAPAFAEHHYGGKPQETEAIQYAIQQLSSLL